MAKRSKNFAAKPDQALVKAEGPSTPWKTPEEKEANTDTKKVQQISKALGKARDESKPWRDECRDAWREFQAQNYDGRYRKLVFWTCNAYPRYWSDTMVMLPALYNSPPTVVCRRRFDNDKVSRTASIILERFATYLIDACPFNSAMRMAALEFLNSSKATARVYYRSKIVKKPVRVMLQEALDENRQPILVDMEMNGVPVGAIVDTDENGQPYYEKEGDEEEITEPQVLVEALHFDEHLINAGARRESSVWFRAYKITVTRKEAYEMFGDIVNKIPAESKPQDGQTAEDSNIKNSKELFTYTEFWDKRQKKVYYVHESMPDAPLTNKYNPDNEDPYDLAGFFPSPRDMMTNERYSDLYPVPDYTQTRDLYENLHISAKRINRTIKSIKCCVVYDGSNSDLDSFFQEITDGQGIAIGNYKDLMNNGGLDQLISIPDYSRQALVLKAQIETFAQQKQDLDEIRGISDIIRGNSDPQTSATAERIKKALATNKFSLRQKEMARFVRDTIEMMCDLGLKEELFSDDQIKEIVGFKYMDAEDQANFPQALLMLRDDKARLVRVDIETDSIISMDEQEDIEAAAKMSEAISQYMQAFVPLMKDNPEFAPLLIKQWELVISKFRFGKQVQDEMSQGFKELMDEIRKGPKDPGPNPEMEKIASAERIAIAKLQSDERIAIAKLNIEGGKLQVKREEINLDAAIAGDSANREREQSVIEAQGKQIDAQTALQVAAVKERGATERELIKQQGASADRATDMAQHQDNMVVKGAEIQATNGKLAIDLRAQQAKEAKDAHDASMDVFDANLANTKLGIDTQLAEATLREKMVEEARLVQQNVEIPEEKMELESRLSMIEGAQQTQGQAPVVVNVGGQDDSNTVAKIVDDGMGGLGLVLPKKPIF